MTTKAHIEEAILQRVGKPRISAWLRQRNTPGLSFVTFMDGAIDVVACYGERSADFGAPIRSETLFQVGDLSAPIAALVALQMAADGLFDLEADINDLLTSWKLPTHADWQPRITARQLLSHTAGLNVPGFWGYSLDDPIPTLQELLIGSERTHNDTVQVAGLPGHAFAYSSGGYLILQQLIEDLTGEPFRDVAYQRLLRPLELFHSHFTQPLVHRLHKVAASGHYYDGTPIEGGWQVYPQLAAAGLWTTPGDLARLALAIQRAANADDGPLAQEVVLQMMSPVVEVDQQRIMGLGMIFAEDRERVVFGYSGATVGYRALLEAYLDGSGGFVLAANSDLGETLFPTIREAIREVYGWQDDRRTQPIQRLAFPPGAFASYERDGRLLRLERSEAGQAVLLFPGQHALPVYMISANQFVAGVYGDPLPLETVFRLRRDEWNHITALEIWQFDLLTLWERA